MYTDRWELSYTCHHIGLDRCSLRLSPHPLLSIKHRTFAIQSLLGNSSHKLYSGNVVNTVFGVCGHTGGTVGLFENWGRVEKRTWSWPSLPDRLYPICVNLETFRPHFARFVGRVADWQVSLIMTMTRGNTMQGYDFLIFIELKHQCNFHGNNKWTTLYIWYYKALRNRAELKLFGM